MYAQAAITQMGVGYGGGPRMTRTYVHAMEQVLSLLALLVQKVLSYLLYSCKKVWRRLARDAYVHANGAERLGVPHRGLVSSSIEV